MTDLTLAADQYSSPETTLTANAVWSVTFAEDANTVEIVSDGAAKIRWTADGSTPDADHGWFMPALVMVDARPTGGGRTVVKLWSPGTPTVVVQRA